MGEDSLGEDRVRVVLPQLRLDDLLSELQSRLTAVLTTRDRVHALLEAVVSIGGDLDLETVLRRLVEAATKLVEARYGALGVIGESRDRLVRFITVGVSAEQIAEIGPWPTGHGVLGLLIKQPSPVRLADISQHPESYGFPADHPPMRSFLGVPIRVRGEVFGNLYLTEKAGGAEFDEDDESVVTALATAAGVAIENARLYQEARQREAWLEVSREVSTTLLSGIDPGQVLPLVARRAREMCDADLAVVVVAADEEFHVVAADGTHADDLRGLCFADDHPAVRQVLQRNEPLILADAKHAARAAGVPEGVPIGPALLVPLGAQTSVHGLLSIVNRPSRPGFTALTQRLLQTFAAQAAVALEVAERRADAERLHVLEDRDRIAKDLHDTVIQRLFATAMALMTALKITRKPEVAARVRQAVDDLDDTIRQIRSTIFALQHIDGEQTLRTRVHHIADGATQTLGFAPAVRIDGLLDVAVDERTGEHLLAVLNEALSNAARHANASRVSVSIDVRDDLTMTVEDNGVGITPGGRRSGLRHLADRARQLGGTFATRDADAGGTVLEWRVPLAD